MIVTIESLENIEKKVTVPGTSEKYPTKHGYLKQRTIGGKPKVSHGVIYPTVTISLQMLNDEAKGILEYIWSKNHKVIATTEKFEKVLGYIDLESFKCEETPVNGEYFYSITFDIIS
jgi:hypothetical protein